MGAWFSITRTFRRSSLQPDPTKTQSTLFGMTSNSLVKLNSPARCVILCSTCHFGKHADDQYGTSILKEVVQYASGDYEKTSLLGTLIYDRVFIVFDYDNPHHLDNCKVLGFKFKKSIRPFYAPEAYIHKRVNGWARENELSHLSFPRQCRITSSKTRNLSHRPPSIASMSASAAAEESIAKDLETAKESSTAKHTSSNNESGCQQTP